jgi:hypothetical protein
MKRAALVSILALSLGGCLTAREPGTVPVTGDYITSVQQTAVSLCGFLPTAQFIGNLFLEGETYDNVSALAGLICRAVTTRSYRPGKTITVDGVPVEGRFVRTAYR